MLKVSNQTDTEARLIFWSMGITFLVQPHIKIRPLDFAKFPNDRELTRDTLPRIGESVWLGEYLWKVLAIHHDIQPVLFVIGDHDKV